MNIKERIRAIRIANKARDNPKFMEEIGVKAEMIHKKQEIDTKKKRGRTL